MTQDTLCHIFAVNKPISNLSIDPNTYEIFLDGLLSGNRNMCVSISQKLLDEETEIKNLYENLFQRSMYKVGELWEANKISVATEHMATAIVESILSVVYPHIFSEEHLDKKAVVSCVPGEFHQLGAKMVADMFELNRWHGYFLGSNTPNEDLLMLIDELKPDLLCVSISIYFNFSNLVSTIEKVRNNYKDLDILVGGQAFRWGGQSQIKRFSNVHFVDSLNKLEQHLK